MIRNAAALGLLALLCGCAATPRLPPAGTAFDGTYVGHSALVRGGGQSCGIADLPNSLTVKDGRFAYPFQVAPPTVAPLQVQVAANGTFNFATQYFAYEELFGPHYETPWVTIKGRIANGTLAATEDDQRCTRRSVLQRR